jgi:holo-[acyl-carrier protein] synthase
MIGIDIVAISRIEKMYEKFGNKVLNRFLCKDEIKLVKNMSSYAGFWAAKEAASKAIGTGIGKKCSFHDIIITKTKNGQPILDFNDKVKDKFNIKSISLSISHDGGFAIAVVIIS